MVKYLKWILPALFIAYYSGISLLAHVHIENGTTIVHAHPFKSSPSGEGHKHASLAEIQLFHTLSFIQAIDGSVHALQLRFFLQPVLRVIGLPVYTNHFAVVTGAHLLRAPPFMA